MRKHQSIASSEYFLIAISSYFSTCNDCIIIIYGAAKYCVDVKEGGEGEGSDLNVQWTLSGVLVHMSTAPYCEHNKTARTYPSQERSIKFSVGLPQPAYAFVTDMSVLTNSP